MASGRGGGWWFSGTLVLLVAMLVGAAAAASSGNGNQAPKSPLRGAVDPATRFLLGQALSGALARLEEPACRAVFADFSDGTGRALDRVLEESGHTGRAYLGLLFFTDGAGHPHCEGGVVGAFTVPGSRVVRVCPVAVRRLSRQDPALVEALLIHELLHALGLHENPPTPDEIDARVESRCLARRHADQSAR